MLAIFMGQVSSALDLNPLLDLTSHVSELSAVLQEKVFFRDTIEALIFKTLARWRAKQVRLALELSCVGKVVRVSAF